MAFLPFPVGVIVSSTIASRTMPIFGPRVLATAGFIAGTLGVLWLTQLSPDASYALHVVPSELLISLGMGHVFVSLSSTALLGVPNRGRRRRERAGQHDAAGRWIARHRIPQHHRHDRDPALRPHRTAILRRTAVVHGFTTAFWVGAGVMAAAAVMVLLSHQSRNGPPSSISVEAGAMTRHPRHRRGVVGLASPADGTSGGTRRGQQRGRSFGSGPAAVFRGRLARVRTRPPTSHRSSAEPSTVQEYGRYIATFFLHGRDRFRRCALRPGVHASRTSSIDGSTTVNAPASSRCKNNSTISHCHHRPTRIGRRRNIGRQSIEQRDRRLQSHRNRPRVRMVERKSPLTYTLCHVRLGGRNHPGRGEDPAVVHPARARPVCVDRAAAVHQHRAMAALVVPEQGMTLWQPRRRKEQFLRDHCQRLSLVRRNVYELRRPAARRTTAARYVRGARATQRSGHLAEPRSELAGGNALCGHAFRPRG